MLLRHISLLVLATVLATCHGAVIKIGEKPSYVFLGCTTEMPGWETKPYAALERANAGSYSMVQANAAQSNATYFLISRGATENYEGSSAYWFRQDKPAPLKLAAGNFQACHTPCAAGDKSKMCGSAEDDGARLWAVYGTPEAAATYTDRYVFKGCVSSQDKLGGNNKVLFRPGQMGASFIMAAAFASSFGGPQALFALARASNGSSSEAWRGWVMYMGGAQPGFDNPAFNNEPSCSRPCADDDSRKCGSLEKSTWAVYGPATTADSSQSAPPPPPPTGKAAPSNGSMSGSEPNCPTISPPPPQQSNILIYALGGAAAALAIALLAAAVVIFRQRKQLAHGKASAQRWEAPSSSAAASGCSGYPVFAPLNTLNIHCEGKAGDGHIGVNLPAVDTYEARDKPPVVLKI